MNIYILVKSLILFYILRNNEAAILVKILLVPHSLPHSLALSSVIPVAITAIYLSKQGVPNLGYKRAQVSFHL